MQWHVINFAATPGSKYSVPITRLPQIDDLIYVFALDLPGSGASCLFHMGFENESATGKVDVSHLDLNGGVKTHLMKHWTDVRHFLGILAESVLP